MRCVSPLFDAKLSVQFLDTLADPTNQKNAGITKNNVRHSLIFNTNPSCARYEQQVFKSMPFGL